MAPSASCPGASVAAVDWTTLGIAGTALFGLGALVAVLVRANHDYHAEQDADR